MEHLHMKVENLIHEGVTGFVSGGI